MPRRDIARTRPGPNVAVACKACRRRKIICDGARPACSNCGKAHRSGDCAYDRLDPNESRRDALKRENEALRQSLDALPVLVDAKYVLHAHFSQIIYRC